MKFNTFVAIATLFVLAVMAKDHALASDTAIFLSAALILTGWPQQEKKE